MSKKVGIGPRPSSQQKAPASSDQWVENPEKSKAMKRLTVDISEDLHRKIKADCAMRGIKIADMVRQLLANKYDSK